MFYICPHNHENVKYMAQFLIITRNSLSLQSSPILRINHLRNSKRGYIILLRTLSKYVFFRRLSLQKKYITSEFIEALRLESDIENSLGVADIIPLKTLTIGVYNAILSHLHFTQPYEIRPIFFNLGTYDFSFFDVRHHVIDEVDDLPY